MKRIVAITGPDGAGKSTLIQRWVDYAREKGIGAIQEISIWDALAQEPLRSRFPIPPAKIDDYLAALKPEARAYFLAHALEQALKSGLENPNSDLLMVNSYWMKYLACEAAHGVSERWLRQLGALFPPADQTLYLDLPVAAALARKERLTGYETAFAPPENRREAFTEFQSRAHAVLHRWRDADGWSVVDATLSADAVFERSREILGDFIA